METISFTKSEGKGRRAIIAGYSYTKHRLCASGTFSQWYCIRRTSGCKGRVRIAANEQEFRLVSEHNHPPNFGEGKATLALAAVKQHARDNPNSNPLHLTQALLTAVDSETAVSLPKEKSVKRAIQRIRREHQPALPVSLAEMAEVPEQYRQIDGSQWLVFDNREEDIENRILIFAGEGVFRDMGQSDMWFGDGTFECVARILA